MILFFDGPKTVINIFVAISYLFSTNSEHIARPSTTKFKGILLSSINTPKDIPSFIPISCSESDTTPWEMISSKILLSLSVK